MIRETIKSNQEVISLVASLRNLKKGFITNFYPDPIKMDIWIKHSIISFLNFNETILFFVENDGFFSLFFCTTSLIELEKSLENLPNDTIIIDWVYRDYSEGLDLLLKKNRFVQYSSLFRMGKKIEKLEEYSIDPHVRKAKEDDIPAIKNYFSLYFDKYIEQIPSIEELVNWIGLGHILVYEMNELIAGFIIYDCTPALYYLRYWFVNPEYRENRIGSALLRASECGDCLSRRQMLWVIDNNDNAIKRYEHYGFIREQLTDIIYMRKIENI